jgi:hypothetical protein
VHLSTERSLFQGSLQRLAKHIGHVLEILVVPHQRHSHVTCTGEHIGGHWEWVFSRGKSPVDKIPGVGLVPEKLDRKSVVFALFKENLNSLWSEFLVKVELERVMNGGGHSRGIDRDGQMLTASGLEGFHKLPVSLVVLLDTWLKGLDLRTHDGGRKSTHSEGVVRDLGRELLEVLWSRDSDVLSTQALVGTGVNSSLSSNIWVVSEQEPTLSGVDHLVRLGRDGTGDTNMASVLVLPADSEGMGAILEQDSIVLIACSLDGIHVGNLSTHVGDKDVLAVRVGLELLGKVSNIHDVVVVGFNVNSLKKNKV